MGSGTTLIAAQALGRAAHGFDLDPLAVTLAKAGTTRKSSSRLGEAAAVVLEKAREYKKGSTKRELLAQISWADRQFINYWFPERSQIELSAISAAIREQKDHQTREFLWATFSNLIVAKSAGASFALDLARSRPHRVLSKPVAWPFEIWQQRTRRVLAGVDAWGSLPEGPSAKALCGDARSLPVQDESVDFVLTSPPYLHAIDYIRAHKFALVWMGSELSELRTLRSVMIGAERGLFSRNGLPDKIESKVERSGRSTEARTRRYLSDLHSVLAETGRVLKVGGCAVFVMGDSIVNAQKRDSDSILRVLAEDVGLAFVGAESRKLKNNRRSLPPPNAVSAANSLWKRMRREIFVALCKLG